MEKYLYQLKIEYRLRDLCIDSIVSKAELFDVEVSTKNFLFLFVTASLEMLSIKYFKTVVCFVTTASVACPEIYWRCYFTCILPSIFVAYAKQG